MPPPGPAPTFRFEHHRRVILLLDTVESVRLMEHDEHGFIRRWHQFVHDARHVVVPTHRGRFRKSTGDGFLLEFDHAESAVRAAVDLRRLSRDGNAPLGADAHMHVRIAAHLADYVADEYDIYGSGVNLASRLLSLARPGDIVVSAALREMLAGTCTRLQDLGLHQLRHVSQPAHAFRVIAPDAEADDAGDDAGTPPPPAGGGT